MEGPSAIRSFADLYAFEIPSTKGADSGNDHKLRFFVGRNWLVTLFDGELEAIQDFRDRDEEETERGRLTGTGVMADILMSHIEVLRHELASIERGVDDLDENILRSQHNHDPLLALTVLRRRVSRLRRVVSAIRPVVSTLTRPGFSAILTEADHEPIHGLANAVDRLSDEVVRTRETVVGSYELYTTKVSQDTNSILEILTIVTFITGCIGAAAGVFGMNFQTPFFEEGERGFHLVTTVMSVFALCAGILIFIKLRRKW